MTGKNTTSASFTGSSPGYNSQLQLHKGHKPELVLVLSGVCVVLTLCNLRWWCFSSHQQRNYKNYTHSGHPLQLVLVVRWLYEYTCVCVRLCVCVCVCVLVYVNMYVCV